MRQVIELIEKAKRPVFIWGAGMRNYRDQCYELASKLGIPVCLTWGAIDCLNYDERIRAGGFGTHGTRAANFTVQNADLVVSLGSRLDTKATGDPRTFARGAQIVMVDVDERELGKFDSLGCRIDIPLQMDVGVFLRELNSCLQSEKSTGMSTSQPSSARSQWIGTVSSWRAKYDTGHSPWHPNPYQIVKDIAKWTKPTDTIVSDTGTVLGYLMQAFPFKGERFLHAFNMTPMGYGLPGAIGASFATGNRVLCITGDGSIMMSLPELATIKRWDLDIKVILLNNHSHAMCVQTERQWFGGRNASTTPESGLGFPQSFSETAKSFGIAPWKTLANLFGYDGPGFLEIEIPEEATLIPQCRFGQPLEDGEPLLSRDEFREQMIVRPL